MLWAWLWSDNAQCRTRLSYFHTLQYVQISSGFNHLFLSYCAHTHTHTHTHTRARAHTHTQTHTHTHANTHTRTNKHTHISDFLIYFRVYSCTCLFVHVLLVFRLLTSPSNYLSCNLNIYSPSDPKDYVLKIICPSAFEMSYYHTPFASKELK